MSFYSNTVYNIRVCVVSDIQTLAHVGLKLSINNTCLYDNITN